MINFGFWKKRNAIPRSNLLLYLGRPNLEAADVPIGDDTEIGDDTIIRWMFLLPADADIRAATGWVTGVGNIFYDAAGDPVAVLASEIAAWSSINQWNVLFHLVSADTETGRLAIYDPYTVSLATIFKAYKALRETQDGTAIAHTTPFTDAIGANTRTLYDLQYLHLSGATDLANASITGTETVTSQPAETAAITVAAGKLTIGAGDLWSFALSNGSTYEFGTILTATSGICFDTSGNGRHLTFTVEDISVACVSGKDYGSDYLNKKGWSQNSEGTYLDNSLSAPINSGSILPSVITGGTVCASSIGRVVENLLLHTENFALSPWLYPSATVLGKTVTFGSGFLKQDIPISISPGDYFVLSFKISGDGYAYVTLSMSAEAPKRQILSILLTSTPTEYIMCLRASDISTYITILFQKNTIKSPNATYAKIDDIQIEKDSIYPSPYIESASTQGSYFSNLSVAKKRTRFAFWGDSITAGRSGDIAISDQFAFILMPKVSQCYNGGVWAQTSTQIATRMLLDANRLGDVVIIWAGRNNYVSGSVVKTDIASMVAQLKTDNYLVLSILNGDSASEHIGGVDYNTIITLNTELEAIYGENYLDIRSALVSAYNPSIPSDVEDNIFDVSPGSLRYDSLHLNSAGNLVVASVILEKLSDMRIVEDIPSSPLSSIQYPNRAKYNLTTISNTSDTDIIDNHTYSLANSDQVRKTLGWTWGVEHWAYSADGVPKVIAGATILANGTGPNIWANADQVTILA